MLSLSNSDISKNDSNSNFLFLKSADFFFNLSFNTISLKFD